MRLFALLLTGVIAPFAPPQPYGPGHRGVDFSAADGQAVTAPATGTIAYVGTINGVGTITIAFGARKVTLQPVVSSVILGSTVARGQIIGRIHPAKYHCTSCLHVGVREGGRYINPLFLSRGELLPIGRASWIDDQ